MGRGLDDLLRLLDMLAALPRWVALAALLVFASMLVLGLRYPRFYLCLGGAVMGVAMGAKLAASLGVSPWHVAPVTAAAAAAVGFFVKRLAVPVILALTLGVAAGALLAADLGALLADQLRPVLYSEADFIAYWLVVLGAVLLGLAVGSIFSHFCTALVAALVGTAGIVGTAGAAARATAGALAPGGYREAPLYWMIAAFVLVVVSMMAQAALEPDELALAAEDASEYD